MCLKNYVALDSQSAASRLIGTRFGACPAGVPMSRDAAGTSACATGPVGKCEVIFAWSLSACIRRARAGRGREYHLRVFLHTIAVP
jgi:hypothetical protein